MILYFSATGNSEYVAKRIGKETGEDAVNLFEKIRDRDFTQLHSAGPWIVAVPTYAWRIPRIVQEWLRNTKLAGSREIYFVMTCGGSIGNAGKYLKTLCHEKQMNYMGCMEIVMPENYIAMFATPARETALEIIRQAESVIDETALMIKDRRAFPEPALTLLDRMNSGIINHLFYPFVVHAKKFFAADTCISCGKCAQVCPLKNIRLENGKPAWGSTCTHCMACICRCPSEAIEYGRHSKGKPRYICPDTETL